MTQASDPFAEWDRKAADLPAIEAASELFGAIYDCALDPSRWDAMLVAIREMFRRRNAALTVIDLVGGSGALIKIAGADPYWLERLALHGAEVAAWERLPAAYNWPLDEPQVRSRHLPVELQQQSRMAKEWAAPQGLVDSMALVLMHSPTRHAHIGLGRHKDVGLITEREVVLGRLLVPDIRRAAVIGDLIDLKTIEASRASLALDALSVGVVLTDAAGKILHANSAAEAMLRVGDPIHGNGGTIRTNLPAAADELLSAIALASREAASVGKAGLALRLTQAGEPPMLAHLLPLAHGDLRTRLQPKAAAAVFIAGVAGGDNGAEAMSVAFDLTRMETRVLALLLAGQTLNQTAQALRGGTADYPSRRLHRHPAGRWLCRLPDNGRAGRSQTRLLLEPCAPALLRACRRRSSADRR